MRVFVTAALSFCRIAFVFFTLLFCTSCAELETQLEVQRKALSDALKTALAAPHPRPAYWRGGYVADAPKIVIHLREQRAYFFKGKHLVGESNISTGRKGYETPPGKYRVIQKDEHHVSSEYGDYVGEDGEIVKKNISVRKDPQPPGTQFDGAKMPYFLRFTRGYGMHAGFVPRYRASHGCIRMPAEMAKHFFDAAEEDTPVIVKE
jgi:lipoprotein-anchoring transpeptidase ErfK/SrfK